MKKLFSLALAAVMVLSLSAVAFATAPSASTQGSPITSSGSTGSSEVQLVIGDGQGGTGAGAGNGAFSVTVPTALPFAVDSSGTVSAATDARIVNSSNGPIKVTGVAARGANSWALVTNGTNFKQVSVDTKQFTLTINGDNFPAAATGAESRLTLTPARWTSIAGKGGSLALTYAGDFAIQSSNIDVKVADVVFTVSWDTAA